MDDDIIDIHCDPKNPREIKFEDITTADLLLMDEVLKTPCTRAMNCIEYDMDLFFKKEFLQPTGSFQSRGARHALRLLSDEKKRRGVITASTGNHALAISYQGYELNIPVTVVVPTSTAASKIEKCRSYKAHVIIEGRDIGESRIVALVLARERRLEFINGSDHTHIIAANGTIAFEILKQVPKVDAIVVPVGGGGLLAGIAKALKTVSPQTQVIGVELEKCPSFQRAMANESPVYTPPNSSLAEGLLVPKVGYNAFATAAVLLDKLVVVREAWVALAMLRLLLEEECVVEGAGAVGLAAVLSGQLNEFKKKRVVVLLSGSNTDAVAYGRALERGMAVERRLLSEDHDVCGAITLFEKLEKLDLNVHQIMSECVWLPSAYKMEMEQRKKGTCQLLSFSALKTQTDEVVKEEKELQDPRTSKIQERNHMETVRDNQKATPKNVQDVGAIEETPKPVHVAMKPKKFLALNRKLTAKKRSK
uniref:Serine racemase n=1 Tax=Ceratitis capitata TaxID=7213 RepID=W8BWZ7_CERCA